MQDVIHGTYTLPGSLNWFLWLGGAGIFSAGAAMLIREMRLWK